MTPFLVAVMGVSAPTAIGTDMVFATLTKFTGSIQHYRQQSVNLEVAIFLGLGSIPAGLLGVATLEWIEGSFDAETVRSIMITIIAITLVLVGGSLILRNFLPEREDDPKPGVWDGKSRMSRRRRMYTVVFGAMGGYLVGLTSIGSGSVMAVILLLLYPIAPAVIVGTDIAHATVLSLVVGLAHMTQGNVEFALAGSLLLGGIPGVLIGSRIAP
ncbi:MAG: sulfite exporter TauE/SafE family protein, partial [Actinomycetota bacterium]|nr:sulfite exporter TauE/SafE family protein [Actinomycetota bacterium]